MTRFASSAILVAALAAPSVAAAQHQAGGAPSVGTATSSAPAPSSSSSSGSSSGSSGGATASTYAAGSTSSGPGHSRGNQPATGTAVPRGSVAGSGGTIVIGEGSGFYPWGGTIGAYGLDAYYGGYYGGYYGAYDPWYGWFPTFAPASSYRSSPDNTGSVRLRVKPSNASVYVDGFLAGIVDDFDGAFQRLRLEPGPHRIEIRAQGYQPLAVDVMIQEDFTITYRGELTMQP